MSWKSESESHSVMSDSLWAHGLYSPWNSPRQSSGVGSCSLLQGFFPNHWDRTQSPALQADSLPAEPQGKPRVFISRHISEVKWLSLSKLFQNTFLSCLGIFIISCNEDNLICLYLLNVSSLQKRSPSLQV